MGYAAHHKENPWPTAIVSEDDLEAARQHLANAHLRVLNQRKLIALLAVRRQPLIQAREVLALLEATHDTHRRHLASLEEAAAWRSAPLRQASSRERAARPNSGSVA